MDSCVGFQALPGSPTIELCPVGFPPTSGCRLFPSFHNQTVESLLFSHRKLGLRHHMAQPASRWLVSLCDRIACGSQESAGISIPDKYGSVINVQEQIIRGFWSDPTHREQAGS